MTDQKSEVFSVAGGDIDLWIDVSGVICLKVRNKYNDPVELAEHEALHLANLLNQLVKEQRT